MEGILALSIPIIALMIPIVAIVVKSQVGKALANYIESKSSSSGISVESLVKSEQLYMELDNRIQLLEREMKHLQEDNDFMRRLLKDKNA